MDTQEQFLNKDRWENRRAMVWLAFISLLLTIPAFFLGSSFLDTEILQELQQFNSIFIVVIGVKALIILYYFGLVTKDDMSIVREILT